MYIYAYFRLLHSVYMETVKRKHRLIGNKSSYKDLVNVELPRSLRKRKRTSTESQRCEKIFPIEIVGKEGKKVKVHYIGYDNKYDEWKDEEEILDYNESRRLTMNKSNELMCKPFSLYEDLAIKIKRALTCRRSGSPLVKIVMPFDVLLFNGGLKLAGKPSKKVSGVQYFTINHYKDLNKLLGKYWHVRGINSSGDYGFVIKDTLQFAIKRCRSVPDYVAHHHDDSEVCVVKSLIDTGHCLTFNFTEGYGNSTTFGKDKNIFYDC